MPKAPSKRRQRAHDVLPAGFTWRDGRPRWIPSPTRRRQGWKAVDIKDAWGKYLARGAAIQRAEMIAGAVEAWAKGEPVPSAFIAIAPKGADLAGAGPGELSPRSIGVLLAAYYAAPAFAKDIAASTQRDYRNKLNRFLEVVAAPVPPRDKDGAIDKAKMAKKVAGLKALDVDIFLPPAFGSSAAFILDEAYDHIRTEIGEHMAYGVLRAVSAWLGWCVKKKRVWSANPCAQLEVATPGGRLRTASWPELVAMVKAADALNYRSIGDAIILAVDLSWSQKDLLALTWDQVSPDFHIKHRRIKTGNAGNPRLLAVGRERLAEVKARLSAEKVRELKAQPIIVCERTGGKWDEHDFRHRMLEVRALAAMDQASVATLKFLDLRDTAVTYAFDAGLTIPQVCSRTLHSLKRAEEVIQKHYGQIGQGIADEGADKLDVHFAKMGYSFKAGA